MRMINYNFLKMKFKYFIIVSISLVLPIIICSAKLAGFGHEMREEFLLAPNYINLNHGSYGTYPKAVRTALHNFQNRAEANPDLWFRKELKPELDHVRAQLASLMSCDAQDLVMIPNTTGGMNAIFRSMVYQFGDKILHFSTIYYAMRKLIEFTSDYSQGAVSKVEFNATFPMTNEDLITNLETFILQHLPIRLALIDHITSVPGVVQPIEQIIPILKKYNISVLIDGAHAIGQIPINITELNPDYYITNCHKWLYAARGCSVMYVSKSLQGSVHPASISSSYSVPSRYQDEFFWTGTTDYSSYLTVSAALEFRRQLGGEEAVINYTHSLAVKGGQLLAKRFGTRIIQETENQIGNMVDVALPLDNHNDPKLTNEFWGYTLLHRFSHLFAPPYKHGGIWWIRLSAQIYNDLSDFEEAGFVFETICREVNNGEIGTTVHARPVTENGSSSIHILDSFLQLLLIFKLLFKV